MKHRLKIKDGMWVLVEGKLDTFDEIISHMRSRDWVLTRNLMEGRLKDWIDKKTEEYDPMRVAGKGQDLVAPSVCKTHDISVEELARSRTVSMCVRMLAESTAGSRRVGGGNTVANTYDHSGFADDSEFDPHWGMSESEFFGGDVGDKG